MMLLSRDRVLSTLILTGASFGLAPSAYGQELCASPDAASLYGVVRLQSDVPVSGVFVLVTWESGQAEASSGADGSYLVCSVPYDTPINVVAVGASALADAIELRLPQPDRYELDIALRTIGPGVTTGTGGISGTAVDSDTNEPIVGARIRVPDAGVDALTGSDGTFRLAGLASGERTLVLEHVAYGRREAVVHVSAAATAVVRLRVSARPIELEPLEVVVEGTRVHSLEVRGFYERQRWAEATGRGHFFTEEDIRRRNPRLISHLIADVPGTILDCSGDPRGRSCQLRFIGSTGIGAGCERANVYIDGARAIRSDNQSIRVPDRPGGVMQPTGLDQLIAPQEIAAIEVYPSAASLPAEFGGSMGQCGAIVIWSK